MQQIPTNQVLFEELPSKNGRIGLVTLNRPEALNALSPEMIITMDAQLRSWAEDPDIFAVIITSSSDKAFCAGGDVKHVYKVDAEAYPEEIIYFSLEYKLDILVKEYPKTYISLVNGIAMGGGLGISVNGYKVVAAENLKLAMPETRIGFFPDTGATFFLARCPKNLGMFLGLTSTHINIANAVYCGLVDHYVPYEKFSELLKDLCQNDIHEIDNILAKYAEDPGPAPLRAYENIIEDCFSRSSVEEIIAALRNNDSPWAHAQAEALETRSPTALKITHRAITMARTMNFVECVEMEFNLVMQIIKSNDFNEGIRAVLVDKTNDPKWQPANLAAVTPEQLDRLFTMQWHL